MIASISSCLESITQPKHPLYHPAQAALFGGMYCISTSLFTQICPISGTILGVLAYSISQIVKPVFIELFEPYKNDTLAPFAGQFIMHSLSLYTAKLILQLAGQEISFKQLRELGIAFLITAFIARFALRKFRQNFMTPLA